MVDEPQPAPAPAPDPKEPPAPLIAPSEKKEGEPAPAPAPEGETPEAKATREAAEKKAADDKAAAEKPIVYEDFKLPEGVVADDAVLKEFKDFASAHKISQEDAQALVDMQVKTLTKAQDALFEQWATTQKAWQKEVEADPEIGGAKLPEVKVTIAKALDQFGTPALKDALVSTGAGNNPEIVRFVWKMAQKLVEGGHVGGNAPGSARPATAAQALYPNLPTGA